PLTRMTRRHAVRATIAVGIDALRRRHRLVAGREQPEIGLAARLGEIGAPVLVYLVVARVPLRVVVHIVMVGHRLAPVAKALKQSDSRHPRVRICPYRRLRTTPTRPPPPAGEGQIELAAMPPDPRYSPSP